MLYRVNSILLFTWIVFIFIKLANYVCWGHKSSVRKSILWNIFPFFGFSYDRLIWKFNSEGLWQWCLMLFIYIHRTQSIVKIVFYTKFRELNLFPSLGEVLSLERQFWLLLLLLLKLKIKSVAYSSQGSHTGQLDFYNWLADDSTTG